MGPTNYLAAFAACESKKAICIPAIWSILLLLLGPGSFEDLSAQISFDVVITQETCPGETDGALSIVNVQGGVSPYSYSIDNGQSYQPDPDFTGLGPGPYDVRVRDNARMVSDSLKIYTDPEPTAICDKVEVALESNGMSEVFAESFDKGSTDNCDELWFKVRRMTPSITCILSGNPANLFSETVKVCCDDLPGDSVIVQVRIYDRDPGDDPVSPDTLSGRYAECMTSVQVRDHLAPVIIQCPRDSVADCKENFEDLSRFGFPDVRDNCSIVDTIVRENINLDQCFIGEIFREFVFVDQGGLRDSCSHVIEIVNTEPFNGLDSNHLTWPDDFTVYGCGIHAVHPDSTGYPVIDEDQCAQVAYYWEDDVYEFAPDACVKIRRHWTVLDWCQYDRRRPRSVENGVWTYTQEIKILDTLAPVLEGPSDTLVYSFSNNCGEVMVQLPAVIAIDCAAQEDMEYRVEVDLDFDGIVDRFLIGDDASGSYPIGEHLITFIVDDKCNNVSKWETVLAVQDGKAPNAVMINRLIIPLMDMGNGGMAFVLASQFDLKSYDNCTASQNLRFSFSPVVSDTIRFYDCDSLGNRPVNIYVTDEAGNQSFVMTYAVIQDNDQICPMTITTQLNGQIISVSGDPMEGIEVELTGHNLVEAVTTDADGRYAFSRIASGQEIQIRPTSPEDWLTGITTKDLILIQQHLLGQKTFQNAEDLIAADADNSGQVSTRDIIWLRKLILGVSDHIPGNHSWRFIDAAHIFRDPSQALAEGFPELSQIMAKPGIQPSSFKAIKVGDVSGDARMFNGGLERRTAQQWNWNWYSEASGDFISYTARSAEDRQVAGFQIEINNPMLRPGLLLSVKPAPQFASSSFHWAFTHDGIRMIFHPDNAEFMQAGEEIVQLRWSGQQILDDLDLSMDTGTDFPSAYYDDQLYPGGIDFKASKQISMNAVLAPNPSQGNTRLLIDGSVQGDYLIDLYGLSGFKLRSWTIHARNASGNGHLIEPGPGAVAGVYIVKITAPDGQVKILKWKYTPS